MSSFVVKKYYPLSNDFGKKSFFKLIDLKALVVIDWFYCISSKMAYLKSFSLFVVYTKKSDNKSFCLRYLQGEIF